MNTEQMQKKYTLEKFAYTVMMFMTLCLLLMGSYAYYLAVIDTAEPTEFLYEKFRVQEDYVCKGEKIEMEMMINKKLDVPGELYWRIVSQNESYATIPITGKAPLGDDQVINPSVRVPSYAQSGKAYLRLDAYYQINSFRRLHKTILSEDFYIMECEE
jgi:hypothetical protein